MLQPESITTTEAGKESYGYTVSDTREYPNLDRNDTAYIPKAVEKNGVSLTLAGIDWQAMGTALLLRQPAIPVGQQAARSQDIPQKQSIPAK